MSAIHRYRIRCITGAILALLPVSVFTQQRDVAAVSVAASGINPDYALPIYPTPHSMGNVSLETVGGLPGSPSQPSSNQLPGEDREVSWRELPLNILHDQKDLWLFPLQLARGRHLLPALFITGGTAAFLATDPQVMPHFRKTDTFHDFNRVFSGTSTNVAMAVVPCGILCRQPCSQRLLRPEHGAFCRRSCGRFHRPPRGHQSHHPQGTPHRSPHSRPLQRHFFQQYCFIFWERHKFPFRALHHRVFHSHNFCATLPRSSLGALRRLCRRHRHRFLARHHRRAFPRRRISWLQLRLRNRPLRCPPRTVTTPTALVKPKIGGANP